MHNNGPRVSAQHGDGSFDFSGFVEGEFDPVVRIVGEFEPTDRISEA